MRTWSWVSSLLTHNSLSSSGKFHEAPKKWCFRAFLDQTHQHPRHGSRHDELLCNFKYMIETSTTGHAECISQRVVVESPGRRHLGLFCTRTTPSDIHHPGILSSFQLHSRYLDRSMKQARPITTYYGMLAPVSIIETQSLQPKPRQHLCVLHNPSAPLGDGQTTDTSIYLACYRNGLAA
jgi:hypothetical protein